MIASRAVAEKTRRLVELVGAMKRGEYPNATRMAQRIRRLRLARGAARRTVLRDVDCLRFKLDAPIEYDPVRHGYYLADPDWVFPLDELRGDLLHASLLGEKLSAAVLPSPLLFALEQAMQTQLTAADPDEIDPELLRAIVFATGATAKLDASVFELVHQAWRERRRMRLRYTGGHEPADTPREFDVHALFLAQGAWYARGYCHRRRAYRSLAIHRIARPELLNARFKRDETVLADVRRGHVFDYANVRNVVIECSPEKAKVIGERDWFPGQTLERLENGRLRLTFPEAPRPELVWWVMSYCGHLTVRTPNNLIAEVRAAGQRVVRQHAAGRLSPAPEQGKR